MTSLTSSLTEMRSLIIEVGVLSVRWKVFSFELNRVLQTFEEGHAPLRWSITPSIFNWILGLRAWTTIRNLRVITRFLLDSNCVAFNPFGKANFVLCRNQTPMRKNWENKSISSDCKKCVSFSGKKKQVDFVTEQNKLCVLLGVLVSVMMMYFVPKIRCFFNDCL